MAPSPRLVIHTCGFCDGPTVQVVLHGSLNHSPRHVRVDHKEGCTYFEALRLKFPGLIDSRKPADVERTIEIYPRSDTAKVIGK